MHREEDDGNIFIGGWSWINNAAGFCLCSRTSSSETAVSHIGDTDLVGYAPSATGHGWTFGDVHVGDLINFVDQGGGLPFYGATGACASILGKFYTVTAVTDDLHMSISPGTGCTATPNIMYIQRANSSSASIRDIYIHNQTWLHNPTDLVWLGHDSYGIAIGEILHRVKLDNNLSIGLDGLRVGRGQNFLTPWNAPAGSHLNLGEGGEDLQVSHETVYGRTEYNHIAMDYGNGGASPASGLVLRDSIFDTSSGRGERHSRMESPMARRFSIVSGRVRLLLTCSRTTYPASRRLHRRAGVKRLTVLRRSMPWASLWSLSFRH